MLRSLKMPEAAAMCDDIAIVLEETVAMTKTNATNRNSKIMIANHFAARRTVRTKRDIR